MIDAETCCHLVTLNKIDIHNTSCVLTCESLLLTCIKFSELFYQPAEAQNTGHKVLFFTLSQRKRKHVVFNKFIFPITAICGQSLKFNCHCHLWLSHETACDVGNAVTRVIALPSHKQHFPQFFKAQQHLDVTLMHFDGIQKHG